VECWGISSLARNLLVQGEEMSEIKVGDLVMIAKARVCGCNECLGAIFKVRDIWNSVSGIHCPTCKTPVSETTFAWTDETDPRCCEMWRLRKIDPLSELESTEHKEELTA
jgi:hypothetical protein